MELFINDLSLHEQFHNVIEFKQAMKRLWDCHKSTISFNKPCYVPRSISKRKVSSNHTFRQAITQLGNKEIERQLALWIDRNGPFSDDKLEIDPDEYVYYLNPDTIVNEEILGQIALRNLKNKEQAILSSLISFYPSDYTSSPLPITWHDKDNNETICSLDNHWEPLLLQDYLIQHLPEPTSWPDMIEQCRIRFTHLQLANDLETHLRPEPFSKAIAKQVFEILEVLNELKSCFEQDGKRTIRGEELLDKYFRRGKKAWFSDASESEKNNQRKRQAMTFRLPNGKSIECFEHGKIKVGYQQYRIHYSPIKHNETCYVAYIGPKLTKQ